MLSGIQKNGPILVKILQYAKSGDTIFVWSLD
jgi:DNA invertase Pin-like site-specific DNA recombinase